MKRVCFLLLTAFCFSSCALSGYHPRDSSWSPYIGCTEEELLNHWGYGGDSSYYSSEYGSKKQTWYHKNLLIGVILPGFTLDSWNMNILITIDDGEISSISYH